MICTVTELEIETIITRIQNKDIDLKPDFQRGEVWSIPKKKKLIDSILRYWKIPPIHVIENENYVDEVLDGQQRLATIRDFMDDIINIDGNLSPIDNNLIKLDGKCFSRLDVDIQRKFKKYSVTVIRLTEYTPEEPAELFYRLNQPASLTSAEQRNAFIGDTRNQIRELVEIFENTGAKKDTIGFSNSRMAYDDIVSKFCYVLEKRTIKKKITSTDISEKYRKNEPFNSNVISNAKSILQFFMESATITKEEYNRKLSLNKATLFSWLIFLNRYIKKLDKNELAELLFVFEQARQLAKGKTEENFALDNIANNIDPSIQDSFYPNMFLIFNQKASVGSTDANSIIHRDIILEIFTILHFKHKHLNDDLYNNVITVYNQDKNTSLTIEKLSEMYSWGADIRW